MSAYGPRGRGNYNGGSWTSRGGGGRGNPSPIRGVKRPFPGEEQHQFTDRPPPFELNMMQNLSQPPPMKKTVMDRLGVREGSLGAHVTGIPEERNKPYPQVQQQIGNPVKFANHRPELFTDPSLRLGERIGPRVGPPQIHGGVINHGPPPFAKDNFNQPQGSPHGPPRDIKNFDYGPNEHHPMQNPNPPPNWNPTQNGGLGSLPQQNFSPRGPPPPFARGSPIVNQNFRGNIRGGSVRMGNQGGSAGVRAPVRNGGPWQGNRGGQRGFPNRVAQRGQQGSVRGNRNNMRSNSASKQVRRGSTADLQRNENGKESNASSGEPKMVIPKEALYCSVCDYAKFESEAEYEKHLKNIYHTGAKDIFKVKHVQFLEYMKLSADLADRQRDNSYAIGKIKQDDKAKIPTPERKMYEELAGNKICCGTSLPNIQNIVDHKHSIKHLMNEFEESNKRVTKHINRELDNQEKTIQVLTKIAESEMLMLENLPSYDENKVCGLQFLVKEDRFFCTVCERAFPTNYAEDHCRTFAHYERLLSQLKKEKALRESMDSTSVEEENAVKGNADETVVKIEAKEEKVEIKEEPNEKKVKIEVKSELSQTATHNPNAETVKMESVKCESAPGNDIEETADYEEEYYNYDEEGNEGGESEDTKLQYADVDEEFNSMDVMEDILDYEYEDVEESVEAPQMAGKIIRRVSSGRQC